MGPIRLVHRLVIEACRTDIQANGSRSVLGNTQVEPTTENPGPLITTEKHGGKPQARLWIITGKTHGTHGETGDFSATFSREAVTGY